jgi:hypothetical protein
MAAASKSAADGFEFVSSGAGDDDRGNGSETAVESWDNAPAARTNLKS